MDPMEQPAVAGSDDTATSDRSTEPVGAPAHEAASMDTSTDDMAVKAAVDDNDHVASSPNPRKRSRKTSSDGAPAPAKDDDSSEHNSAASTVLAEHMPPIHVVEIDGTIGSGKSTQLDALRKHFADDERVCFCDEPLVDWEKYGLLTAFYKGKSYMDANKGMLSQELLSPAAFQLVALFTRMSNLLKTCNQTPRPKVIFCERSTSADKYAFAANLLAEGANADAYELCYESSHGMLPSNIVKHKILLDVAVDCAISRIALRNRECEKNIDVGYMKSIESGHTAMMEHTDSSRAHIIDGSQDVDAVRKQIMSIYDAIVAS